MRRAEFVQKYLRIALPEQTADHVSTERACLSARFAALLFEKYTHWPFVGDAGVVGMAHYPATKWFTVCVVVQGAGSVADGGHVRLVVSGLYNGCEGLPLELPLELQSSTLDVGALVILVKPTVVGIESRQPDDQTVIERSLRVQRRAQLYVVGDVRGLLTPCEGADAEGAACPRHVYHLGTGDGAALCPAHRRAAHGREPSSPATQPSPSPPTPAAAGRYPSLHSTWTATKQRATAAAMITVQRPVCGKCAAFVDEPTAGAQALGCGHSTRGLARAPANKRVYACTQCRAVSVSYTAVGQSTEGPLRARSSRCARCDAEGARSIQVCADGIELSANAPLPTALPLPARFPWHAVPADGAAERTSPHGRPHGGGKAQRTHARADCSRHAAGVALRTRSKMAAERV